MDPMKYMEESSLELPGDHGVWTGKEHEDGGFGSVLAGIKQKSLLFKPCSKVFPLGSVEWTSIFHHPELDLLLVVYLDETCRTCR